MKWQSQEASGTTQTRSNSPITSLDPLRHAACMDNADANRILSTLPQRIGGDLEDVAEHHTAGCEIPQSHTAWSNGYGPKPVSVGDMVDVWCYAILSCMPEMAMTLSSTHACSYYLIRRYQISSVKMDSRYHILNCSSHPLQVGSQNPRHSTGRLSSSMIPTPDIMLSSWSQPWIFLGGFQARVWDFILTRDCVWPPVPTSWFLCVNNINYSVMVLKCMHSAPR